MTGKIVILFLLFLSLRGFSLDVQLSVQTGHSSAVNCLAFSVGDKYLVSGGSDNKIILWDFYTGKQANVFTEHNAPINDICFYPGTEYFFSASSDSTIRLWNCQQKNSLQTIQFNYPVHSLAISENRKHLFVAGKEIRMYTLENDFTSTQKIDEKKFVSLPMKAKKQFTCLSVEQSDTLVAFGGDQEDFGYVIDIKNNLLFKKYPAAFTDVNFDTDSSLVFTTKQGMTVKTKLYERQKSSTSTDWMLNSFHAFEADSNFLFLSNNVGEIRVLNKSTFRELYIFKTNQNVVLDLELSSQNEFLASACEDGRIIIWDLSTKRSFKHFEGSVVQINDIAFSKNGDEILIAYKDGTLRKTNLLSNQSILNSPLQKAEKITGRFVWSTAKIESFETDSAILRMHRKRVAFGDENSFDKIEEYTVVWKFKENILLLTEEEKLSGAADFYMNQRKNGKILPEHFLLENSLLEKSTFNFSYSISSDGENIFIRQGKSGAPSKFIGLHSDRITSIAINEKHGVIASAGWDGLIRFRDLKSGKLLSTFGPFKDGQFIYISPDNYYFSSKRALDFISFKMDEKMYSFEQFDILFNRPDLVAENLPWFDEFYVSAYRAAYQKRLKKLGLTEENLLIDQDVPTINYSRDLSLMLTNGTIKIKIACEDQKHELDRLHIKVNGVPEFGRFGKELNGHKYNEEYEIELNPGSNYIQIYCTNKTGVSSLKESFTVENLKKAQESSLYLVSIGISNYRQSQYNLNFARKDAEDMVRFFSRPFGPFTKVETKILTDSAVTRENILELKTFLSQAKPNDAVIFFMAGHGVLDDDLEYYLASYDMDFKNPQLRGIPYETIDELLDNTRSRKKVLFIDACHSGEIDKDEVIDVEVIESEQGDIKFRSAGVGLINKNETNALDLAKTLFADMRLNNGATVISSAGGTEFAIESENWRNGAFTYCLLYGLSSGKADLDKNKVILLSELQEYLLTEVNKLTNGKQTPTSRVENLNNDFRLK